MLQVVTRVADDRNQDVALVLGENVPRVDRRRDTLVDRSPEGGPIRLPLFADLGFAVYKLDLRRAVARLRAPADRAEIFLRTGPSATSQKDGGEVYCSDVIPSTDLIRVVDA
jgi:hypothetical protein